jgi:regulator of protease activity HflC (stomatin/prohibitin superfamily)
MSHERSVKATHGLIALPLLVATIPASIYGMVWAAHQSIGWLVIASAIVCFATFVSLFGLFTVEPNQGVVLTLFGRYVGTCRETGLRFANPFYSKKKISQRVRNFESGRLKVNELEGSPIEIAAVVVWQVVDTYEAAFEVDDYENFVQIQSESALRQMATRYPYDMHEGVEIALRSHGEEGVEVIEARISHLAYAQEIAQAMLQRQQAGAIIAARARIVEGAVGMVHMALEQLRQGGQVELDEERKAAMISNLLVVLCSDRAAQPVINSGSLY